MKKKIIQARRCFNKMAFTAVSMKLEFWSLFLNKEISSIFETDLVATSQTNSESGGKVGVIIIIYSFLFYGLFSRLGSLLRMFCSPCFSWVINCSTPEITENSDDKTGIRWKRSQIGLCWGIYNYKVSTILKVFFLSFWKQVNYKVMAKRYALFE